MTQLVLIRHPPVMLPAGVCYGASDVAAAAWPQAHVRALRAQLPPGAQVASSPLSRCRRLAESLASDRSCVWLDGRLQEMDFGDWELQPFEAIDRNAIDAWAAATWDFAPPGGESAQTMSLRVLAALDDLLRPAPEGLVVVAHAGPLRVMLGHLLRLPRAQWLAQACDPGSLTRLHLHGDRVGIRVRNALPPYRG